MNLETNKIDFVSVPSFVYGAMENAFLIVFDDVYFVNDDSEAYETIVHEVIHQWIGNKMTIKTWGHTWIKEGLTTFLQTLYLNQFAEFYINQVPIVHQMDSITGSHPLYLNVNTTSQIEDIFDEISYDKGALWFKMLHDILGKEAFQKWIQGIVRNEVIDEEVLLNSLYPALNRTEISDVKYWIHAAGFPVISFDKLNETHFATKQERYYSYFPLIKINSRWSIPFTWLKSDGSIQKVLDKDIVIASDYIKMNPNQVYNIRVNYPVEMWIRIGQNINNGFLSILDKIGLVNDAISLSKTGELSIMTNFQFLSSFKSQFDSNIWNLILKFYKQIQNVLFLESGFRRENFDRFVISSLPASSDPVIKDANSWAHNQTFVEEILAHYLPLNHSTIECSEHNQHIFSTLIRYGDDLVYRSMDSFYEKTSCKYALLALAESKDVSLLKNSLEKSLLLPKIQGIELFSSVVKNPYGNLMAWDYTRENILEIQAVFGPWLIEKHLVVDFANMFYQKERIPELKETFGELEDVSIDDAVEIIRSNIHFVDQCIEDLRESYK